VFRNMIAGSRSGHEILGGIEVAALVIEVLAVSIISVAIFYSIGRFLIQAAVRREIREQYEQLKISLGRSLLLGLETLVAADIVRTVALEATLQSVAILGVLVLIRTFLSWALVVEIEGRWPWQARS